MPPAAAQRMPVRAGSTPPPEMAAPIAQPNPSFADWLIAQGKRTGSIGELAKAVRHDRLFPRSATVDVVRRRFSEAGADGDAFAALEDAEREFDRLWS